MYTSWTGSIYCVTKCDSSMFDGKAGDYIVYICVIELDNSLT